MSSKDENKEGVVSFQTQLYRYVTVTDGSFCWTTLTKKLPKFFWPEKQVCYASLHNLLLRAMHDYHYSVLLAETDFLSLHKKA